MPYQILMEINWDAVSAIGQCVGAFATFLAIFVALMPYKKGLNIEFTLSRYLDNKPILLFSNDSLKGRFIKTVTFYSGNPNLTGNAFWDIDYIDYRDDLASTIDTVYIAPGSMYKLDFDCIRIFHDYSHSGITVNLNRNVYIKITENSKKKYVINTKLKTEEFLSFIRDTSEVYKDSPITF